MSKDFAQISSDVVSGIGLLQRGTPITMEAFGVLSTAAKVSKAIDTKGRN
jgi:hypothetical protein